jgi:hypothetical protein
VTGLAEATRRAQDFVHEHGPILNVVAKPSRCGTCGQRSPISVHHLCVVWLGCGHTTALPPLPVLRWYRHPARV